MKHPHYSLITLFLLLLTSQISAYEQQSINITVNGKQRNMIVFTPNTLPEKSPLMIVTHGMNQDPEYQMGSDKLYEMIDTAKFVVAYLRSNGNTWDTGGTNDQTFVSKTIDEMVGQEHILGEGKLLRRIIQADQLSSLIFYGTYPSIIS